MPPTWASFLKRHIQVKLIIKVAASYSPPFFVETWPIFVGAAVCCCDLTKRKLDPALRLNRLGLLIIMQGDRNRVLPIRWTPLGLSKYCSPTHAGCIITSIAHQNRTFRGKKQFPRLTITEKHLKDSQATHMGELLEAAHSSTTHY